MVGATSLREELHILRAELGRKEPGKQPASADPLSVKTGSEAAPQAEAVADLREQLGELGKALSEHTGGIEEFVKERPLASVLATFTLGIVVGRLMGRA
ncbi:hypothetical protein [Microvirga arabica]|uniref:hypothetical protein n=1 Tax=Microvirga arabica TaxID=1128671 RepID=UPI00193A8285|nr:hypothetical protein [Microvirga arabica]MBM1171782.1 hypothetical protein [Microvirga arabica]